MRTPLENRWSELSEIGRERLEARLMSESRDRRVEDILVSERELRITIAQQAERIKELEGRDKILRLRIHAAERHNQFFERCESPWCNPTAQSDPASQPHGDRHAVLAGFRREFDLAAKEPA